MANVQTFIMDFFVWGIPRRGREQQMVVCTLVVILNPQVSLSYATFQEEGVDFRVVFSPFMRLVLVCIGGLFLLGPFSWHPIK